MVCTGLFLDLGRWFNVSGVPFFWRENPHSVMFELVWCVSGYTFVQLVEFGHVFVERVRAPRLSRVLSKIYVPVLIVGVMLPMLHQSALGSIYLLARGRLDPLWWSMLLPLFFLTSSFFVGPAMVAVENTLAGRAHGRRPPLRIISEMTRLSGGIMLVYFAVKVGDVVWRGAYRELANGSVASDLFLVEMVAGVLIPAVMFLLPRTRRSPAGMLTAASLAVAGVALNRANVVFTGMMASAGGATYVPSWTELVLTFGIVAAGLLAYLFVAENFPVYQRDDVSAVEARRAQEQVRKEAEAA
jgi:Ni/Fe-hydrogenase subunit HybB-like protein